MTTTAAPTAPALPTTLARRPGTGALGLSAEGVRELEAISARMDYPGELADLVDGYVAREMSIHAEAVARGWV